MLGKHTLETQTIIAHINQSMNQCQMSLCRKAHPPLKIELFLECAHLAFLTAYQFLLIYDCLHCFAFTDMRVKFNALKLYTWSWQGWIGSDHQGDHGTNNIKVPPPSHLSAS